MSTHLVELLRQELGVAELQRVDPQSGDTDKEYQLRGEQLAQASIPLVLYGLCVLAKSNDDANMIAFSHLPGNSLQAIFNNSTEEVVHKVSEYAMTPQAETFAFLVKTAEQAFTLVREETGGDTIMFQELMEQQEEEVLSFLPRTLQLNAVLKTIGYAEKTT